MDRRFLIKFAFRNLMAHKMRTFLTICAMVIGIATIVFLIAFAFGIERLVTKEITGGNPFELIDVGTGSSQIVKLNKKSVERIIKLSDVQEAEVIINSAAQIKKIDNRIFNKALDFSFFGTTNKYMEWAGWVVSSGESLTEKEYGQKVSFNNKIVVNSAFASALGFSDINKILNKKINFDVIIPKEISKNGKNQVFKNQEFKIVGVTKIGSAPSIFTNVTNFNHFEIANYSQVKVQADSRENVTYLRKQIENLGFKTQYVGEMVEQVNQVFGFFKMILGGFGMIAVIVASLGMFNILTISLLERIKEVALLKMLGMKRREIMKIFISEALSMGFFGGLFGVISGIIISKIVNYIFNFYALKAGGEAVSVFYYSFSVLFFSFIFSILIGFLTGLYPARRAARVKALDVLRYE